MSKVLKKDRAIDQGREPDSNSVTLSVYTLNKGLCVHALHQIDISDNQPVVKMIDGVLFLKESSTLLCYPGGLTDESYSIPDGTAAIGADAFCNHKYLETIELPGSLKEIGENAFLAAIYYMILQFQKGLYPWEMKLLKDVIYWNASQFLQVL